MTPSPESCSQSQNILIFSDQKTKHERVYTNDSRKKIIAKSNFLLDTLFSCFYTFVNCDIFSRGKKGRIENYGNEKGSQESG